MQTQNTNAWLILTYTMYNAPLVNMENEQTFVRTYKIHPTVCSHSRVITHVQGAYFEDTRNDVIRIDSVNA